MGKNLIVDENMYGYALGSEGATSVYVEHCLVNGSGSVFPPHWHEQLLLMYIKKGTLMLQCMEQRILAEQDSIVLVNPNEIHSTIYYIYGRAYGRKNHPCRAFRSYTLKP